MQNALILPSRAFLQATNLHVSLLVIDVSVMEQFRLIRLISISMHCLSDKSLMEFDIPTAQLYILVTWKSGTFLTHGGSV